MAFSSLPTQPHHFKSETLSTYLSLILSTQYTHLANPSRIPPPLLPTYPSPPPPLPHHPLPCESRTGTCWGQRTASFIGRCCVAPGQSCSARYCLTVPSHFCPPAFPLFTYHFLTSLSRCHISFTLSPLPPLFPLPLH